MAVSFGSRLIVIVLNLSISIVVFTFVQALRPLRATSVVPEMLVVAFAFNITGVLFVEWKLS